MALAKPGAGGTEDTGAHKLRGFFPQYSFTYMNELIKKSVKGEDVALEDCVLPTEQTADVSYNRFQAEWEKQLKSGKPSLRKALWHAYKKPLMIGGLFKFIWSCTVILGAFFFVRTLQFNVQLHPEWDQTWQGWILAAFFFVDAYVLGIALQRMTFGCMKIGLSMRAALTNAICRKSFAMASITKEAASDAVSFVASDLSKVYDGIQDIHYLWTAPIEAGAILIILVILVKEWALPGWGVVFIVMPCQYIFGYFIIKAKKQNAVNTQERGTIMQELLPAMKLIKYYAWEDFFEKLVKGIRAREMRLMKRIDIIKTIQISMVFGTPPMTALVIFAAYQFQVGRITSTLTFPILSLFNILRFPLVVLPKAMRAASDMLAALERIENFLLMHVPERQGITGQPGIHMHNCEFRHPGTDNFSLKIKEFSCRPGELVAVVGRVGAGKSSLINAVLGNMEQLSGTSSAGGRMSYVPQNPWCQNLSLRDNIVFGEPWNEEHYDGVIHDCALEFDLQILPLGDQCKAGLRGINLSGGQRQRMNLARAAYYNGDVFLLDNALSAVDHHTAHHIFKHLLKDTLRDKAIVLITHQVEFLPQCDKVAIMDNGTMLYYGPWNQKAKELLSTVLPTSHLLAAAGGAEQPRDNKPAAKKEKASSSKPLDMTTTNVAQQMGNSKAKLNPTSSTLGQALWKYFFVFSPAYGVVFLIGFVIFLAVQTSRQISDWWLRQWTSDAKLWFKTNSTDSPYESLSPAQAYVITYAIPVIFFVLMMLARGAFHHWHSHGSGQKMYLSMLHNTMYAPLGFFLQNPVGELLLAFTKEQDIIDENLVDSLHYLGIYGLIMLSTIITVSVTLVYFSAFAGALVFITLFMLVFYLPTASKLKKHRIETAGSLVGLVAETLEGLPVVQAFGKTQFFVDTAVKLNNNHHKSVFTSESLNLWLAHYCDFYGAILVLAVACFAVGMAEELGSATVGLAFSNTIQMLVFYTWSVRFLAESLFNFASVEKVSWLAGDLKRENDDSKKGEEGSDDNSKALSTVVVNKGNLDADGVPVNWPSSGVVEFKDVWMKYAPTAPFALKGVSWKVGHAEKVGVVGRTGSGKSTLLLALYRMFILDKGTIYVDGVDVSSMPLKRLRRGLSIIPQEPMVFQGTVRENFDPYSEADDNKLWTVIRQVGLEDQVKRCGGLEARIGGSGSNWSLGQMQLVCLGRAALRQVPVLCLDEATAAMDPHTEQEVQAVIKRMFADRTTITIAHRLDTVIESDWVLVMDAGQRKEMESPTDLLNRPDSMFSQLVDKTGKEAAAALRAMAAQYNESRRTTVRHFDVNVHINQGRHY